MTWSSLLGDMRFWMGPLALILGTIWAFRFGTRLGTRSKGQSKGQQAEGIGEGLVTQPVQETLVPLSEIMKEARPADRQAAIHSQKPQALSVMKELSTEEKLAQEKERIRASLPAPPQIVSAPIAVPKSSPKPTPTPEVVSEATPKAMPEPASAPQDNMTVAKVRGGVPPVPTPPERAAEKTTEKVTEEAPKKMPEKVLETKLEKAPEKEPQKIALKGLETFREFAEASRTKDELISRSCRFLRDYSQTGRVVYLNFDTEERSLKVGARSDARVFAGTQPKMFVKAEDGLQNLESSRLLQRTLQDACLLETDASASSDSASREFLMGTRATWTTIPVYSEDKIEGYFALQTGETAKQVGPEFKGVFSTLVGWRASHLDQKALMQRASVRDEEVGVWAEAEFSSRLEESMMTAQRLKHPLTLVRFELEHWDLYIKKYGSEAGSALLRHTVRNIQRVFRRTDLVGRVGANGLCLMMPHTALVDALKKLEDFMATFAKSELRIKNAEDETLALRPFLNVGVAEFPSHCATAEKLLSSSLKALRSLGGRKSDGTQNSRLALARMEQGYVAPFSSRFVRSAPRPLLES